MMFAFGFIEILILAFIAGMVVLFAVLGKRGRTLLAVCAVIPVLVVVVAILASIAVPVVARHRAIHSAGPGGINVSGPNSRISMDSNGMRVSTPSGAVSMDARGMRVSTPAASVSMGSEGMEITTPSGVVRMGSDGNESSPKSSEGSSATAEYLQKYEEVQEFYRQVSENQISSVTPSPEPWKSAADLGLAADLHPSIGAAADSLLVEILKLKDATYPSVDIKRVQVWAVEGVDTDAVSRVMNRLQRKAPDWMVMVEAAEPERPIEQSDEQAASLRLELPKRSTIHRAAWDSNREERGGVLRMRLSWKGGSIDRSTTFADKPWLENTSEFISAAPQMRWVVGYSSPSATDRAEAHRQALRDAAAQIVPEVRARLSNRVSLDGRWMMAAAEQELTGGNSVRDRFVQTLIVNSGGQIVREAVLVQSPAVVNSLEHACLAHAGRRVQAARQETQTWRTAIISAAGMCLLVCVVGVLLNTITKGYYRGRVLLVVGLVLVLLAGSLVLLRLKAASRRQEVYEAVHSTVLRYPDVIRNVEAVEYQLLP